MAELVKLWDGSPSSVIRVRDDNMEFRLSGQRLTMSLVGQPEVVDHVVFSDDAGNGFGPRLLYSADVERPEQMTYDWPDGFSADGTVSWFTQTLGVIRQRQDYGRELLDYDATDRRVINPTPAAKAMLREFNAECELASDSAENNHHRGFLVRSAELAARVAGNLVGWVALQKTTANEPPAPELEYDTDELEPAIKLVRWYAEVIRLRFANIGASKVSDAAQAVAEQLAEVSPETHGKYFTKRGQFFKLRTYIAQNAKGAAAHLRKDTGAKEQVIEILVKHRYALEHQGQFVLSQSIGETIRPKAGK